MLALVSVECDPSFSQAFVFPGFRNRVSRYLHTPADQGVPLIAFPFFCRQVLEYLRSRQIGFPGSQENFVIAYMQNLLANEIGDHGSLSDIFNNGPGFGVGETGFAPTRELLGISGVIGFFLAPKLWIIRTTVLNLVTQRMRCFTACPCCGFLR